jgi:protein CpxP
MASRYKLATLVALPLVIIGAAFAYAHQGGGHHGRPDDSHHMERHLDQMAGMLTKIGASGAQKSQIDGIMRGAFGDLKAAKQNHHAAFGQLHELLFAPSIDRGKIESLRAEQIKSLDEASRAFVKAAADAAEVLSPEQRAAMAQEARSHHGG